MFSIRGLRLYFPRAGALGCAVCFTPPPFLPVYLCINVGPQGLPAAAWPAPFHNPPPHWVHQPLPCCESSPPWLPISASPTGLDECFFFISLVARLPYSLIFCQFWLFFVFKLLSSFFWLYKEAQCVYLHLHLGRTHHMIFKNLPFLCLKRVNITYLGRNFKNTDKQKKKISSRFLN